MLYPFIFVMIVIVVPFLANFEEGFHSNSLNYRFIFRIDGRFVGLQLIFIQLFILEYFVTVFLNLNFIFRRILTVTKFHQKFHQDHLLN
jgi:hypothetical protein